MAPLNFAGKLPIAIVFTWKGESNPNAVTQLFKAERYVVANDLLRKFKIEFGGGRPGQLVRTATKGNPRFDTTLNAFVSDPVSGQDIDDLIAGGSSVVHSIDMTVTHFTFFDELLKQLIRTDPDLRTLANPSVADSATILGTFTHRSSVVDINVDFKQITEEFKGIPCRLDMHTVTPRPGKAPAVKLVFELDFTPFDATSRDIMRKLIAMDWSRLARFGQSVKKGTRIQEKVAVWYTNRNNWLLNNVDISRGRRIRKGIFDRHNGKLEVTLATDLRADIDEHLIAANHWGQDREDLVTERHQRLLSDLFGTLHQRAYLASPVNCLRRIDQTMSFRNDPIDRDDYAALVLQFGVGHCGEHGDVAFSILKEMVAFGAPISAAIRSGNANVDHVFVVYNMDTHKTIRTIPAVDTNKVTREDEDSGALRVFNLKDAIAANGPRAGMVLDAYLDRKDKIVTVEALLQNITGRQRRAQGLNTEFLAFTDQFEDPADFTSSDISALPARDRLRQVPNV